MQELVVEASSTPILDDNVSMILRMSSTSAFAGGERNIDAYLRDTRVIIDTETKEWKVKRPLFGEKSQREIETMDDEQAHNRRRGL